MTQTDRVDGFIGDSAIKAPVRAASTGVLVLTGEQTVDGVALVTGDRVLVKNQASSIANGIYVVDSGAWSRASDFDGTYDVVTGTIVKVNSGSASAGLFYELTTTGDITIGTSALVFAVVSPSSPLTLPLALSQGGTGINAESAAEALASLGVVQCTAVGGTGNAITCTIDDAVTAYRTNQLFILTPVANNTGATTLTPTPDGGVALAGKNIFNRGAACVGAELTTGVPVLLLYDGVQYNIIGSILGSFTLAQLSTAVSDANVGITLATQQASTSGTSIDFTGIPAGVKRITVMFSAVSTNGTSPKQIQIGDSGGIETTGYDGCTSRSDSFTGLDPSGGFGIQSVLAADSISGTMTLTLENSATNTWTGIGIFHIDNAAVTLSSACAKSLSGVLDRVRVTTNGGVDTFDGGVINISYEF